MRLVYAEHIFVRVERALREATQQNRVVEKIILTPAEMREARESLVYRYRAPRLGDTDALYCDTICGVPVEVGL